MVAHARRVAARQRSGLRRATDQGHFGQLETDCGRHFPAVARQLTNAFACLEDVGPNDAVFDELTFIDEWQQPAQIADIRRHKLEATTQLLGDTISVSDEQWQSPSRLPGWTRAHVAAHLARNADAFSQALEGLVAGGCPTLYGSASERRWVIERDSMRSGLEIQIDLDTSAGRINSRLTEMFSFAEQNPEAIDQRVMHRISLIPLARLNETVLHHVDLDIGFEIEQLQQPVAGWLLAFNLANPRITDPLPALELHSSDGFHAILPSAGQPHELTASTAELLGWLTGRLRPEVSDDLGLPRPPAAR